MSTTNRREFIKKSALAAGFITTVPAVKRGFSFQKPNDRINIAVVGIGGRGQSHYQQFVRMENVRVAALCDVDERLFPAAVTAVEKQAGYKPKTVVDFRTLLDDKEIDAVSLATPDHWHALQTIWACQAGKDVYVEKPVSFTINEGRKI
jgi:predicted dehydrogenase